MRRILIGLAVLVVVVAGGAVVLSRLVDPDALRDLAAAEVRAATGRDLTVAGDLDLRLFSFSPALVARDVRFSNDSRGLRPDMLTAERIEAEVALLPLLRGEVVVERLVFVGLDLLLEARADGGGNWVFASATGDGGEATETADSDTTGDNAGDGETIDDGAGGFPFVQEVRVTRAHVTWFDAGTGRTVEFDIDRLEAAASAPDVPVRLTLESRIGDTPLVVEATLGAPSVLLDGDAPWPIQADLRPGEDRIEVVGEVLLAASPARLRLSLAADRLDIATLRRLADSGVDGGDSPGGSEGSGRGRLFDDAPLPLSTLSVLDAEIDLRAGLVTGLGPWLHDVEGRITIADGAVRLAPFAAGIGGGRLGGEVELVDADGTGALSLNLDLEDADLGAVVRELTGEATLTGPLNAHLDLRGAGPSAAAIMASADGLLVAESGRGLVHNSLFAFLSADALAAITPWAPAGEGTAVDCGVVRLDFAGGVGQSRVILLDTTRASVAGEGVVDLRNETLDIIIDPSTRDVSLLSVAALVPLRITGPLRDPRVTPDVQGAVGRTVGNVVGGAVDAADWVGEQIGLTSGPDGASLCPRARAIAAGTAAPGDGPDAVDRAVDTVGEAGSEVLRQLRGILD